MCELADAHRERQEIDEFRPVVAPLSASVVQTTIVCNHEIWQVAAKSIRAAIGINDNEVFGKNLRKGLVAIVEEFVVLSLQKAHENAQHHRAHSTDDELNDLENIQYILFGQAQHKQHIPHQVAEDIQNGSYHGGELKDGDYDHGHKGMVFRDFCTHENSRIAGLSPENVLALRLYTSSSYPRFNRPLRKRHNPHPCRMTVHYLDEGLKNLRSIRAVHNDEEFTKIQMLYRGLAGAEVDEDRLRR